MDVSCINQTLEPLKGFEMHKGKITLIFIFWGFFCAKLPDSTLTHLIQHYFYGLGTSHNISGKRRTIFFPVYPKASELESSPTPSSYPSWVLCSAHPQLTPDLLFSFHPVALSLFLQCTWLSHKEDTKSLTKPQGRDTSSLVHPKTEDRPEHLLPPPSTGVFFQSKQKEYSVPGSWPDLQSGGHPRTLKHSSAFGYRQLRYNLEPLAQPIFDKQLPPILFYVFNQ